MVVWRPEHYRSLNPPILADSQDLPFSRLLISWIYWIYLIYSSIYDFGLHTWSSFRAVSYLIYSIYLTYILADTQDPSYVAFSSTSLTVEKQIMALMRGRGQTYLSLTLSNKDFDEDLFPNISWVLRKGHNIWGNSPALKVTRGRNLRQFVQATAIKRTNTTPFNIWNLA